MALDLIYHAADEMGSQWAGVCRWPLSFSGFYVGMYELAYSLITPEDDDYMETKE